jgi:hypothetical protein
MIRAIAILVFVVILAACDRPETSDQTVTETVSEIISEPGSEPGPADASAEGATHPVTETVKHTDTYHGVQIADPYAGWKKTFVEPQGRMGGRTECIHVCLFRRHPGTGSDRNRLTECGTSNVAGCPTKKAAITTGYNDGLQNQDVVFVQDSLEDEPRLLIDPNTWSEDGTVALAGHFPSPTGTHPPTSCRTEVRLADRARWKSPVERRLARRAALAEIHRPVVGA